MIAVIIIGAAILFTVYIAWQLTRYSRAKKRLELKRKALRAIMHGKEE